MAREYDYSIQALGKLYQFRADIALVDCLLAIAERLEAQVEAIDHLTEAITCQGTVVRAQAGEKLEAGCLLRWAEPGEFTCHTPDISGDVDMGPLVEGLKQRNPPEYGPCGGE